MIPNTSEALSGLRSLVRVAGKIARFLFAFGIVLVLALAVGAMRVCPRWRAG